MPRFFKKELVANTIYINGTPVKWEMIGNDTGIRSFDESNDASIIAELDRLADKRQKGVVRISAEIAAGLQKKKSLAKSANPPSALKPIRAHNPEAVVPKPPAVSVANPAVINRTVPVPSVATATSKQTPPKPVVATASTTDSPPQDATEEVKKFKPRRAKKSEVEAKVAEKDKPAEPLV